MAPSNGGGDDAGGEAPGARAAWPRSGPGARVLGWLAVLALIVLGTELRARTAFADPGFDVRDATGMLRSDPALIAYVAGRVVEAEGALPDDFRTDPRVQHPGSVDLPRDFTVGQELVVGWGYRGFRALEGPTPPLHVFATWVMSFFASLAVVGVYGLVLALRGSVSWALFAALLWAVLPASYRTLSFVLVREDFSLPWLAIHLALLARAARVQSAGAALACGAALVLALATWHAMAFFVAIEAACLFAFHLATGRNVLAGRWAWTGLEVVVAGTLLVPALREKELALSFPLQVGGALLVAAAAARAGLSRGPCALLSVASWSLLLLLSAWVGDRTGAGLNDYAHVVDVVAAKLRYLGRLPEDPGALSFDARLLWQGPFATLSDPGRAWTLIGAGVGILLFAAGAWLTGRARLDASGKLLLAAAFLSLPVAWLIERTIVLAALLVPAAAAVALAGIEAKRLRRAAAALVLLVQVPAFASWIDGFHSSWYDPPGQAQEIRALVRWIDANVPEGEAIGTDFVNGPAVLLSTGRPILNQPKYETVEARRRVQDFLTTFFHGTPEELRTLLLERYRCRYLLVDRYTLWNVMRYAGGVPWSVTVPEPGTAAAAFVSQDAAVLEGVPGYRLVYRSPPTILQKSREPYDLFRLYRLQDEPLAPPAAREGEE